MAANKFATMLHRNKTPKIAIVLIYTLLEWTLIALLLLNGLFSYLIAAFADFFGLKPPCVFCSRVDHVFGPRKSYSDLVCGAHAAEVSRLGYCSAHRNLAKASEMCKDCSAHDRQVAVLSWMKSKEEGVEDLRCSCCDAVLERGFCSPCLVIQSSSLGVLDYAQKEGELDDDDGGDDNLVHEIHEEEGDVENCADASAKGVDSVDESFDLLALVRAENGVLGEERSVPVKLIDFCTLIKSNVSLSLATKGEEEEEEEEDRDYVGYNLVGKNNDTAMDDDEEEEEEEEKVALLSTEEECLPVDHQREAPEPVSILERELDSEGEVERAENYGEFQAPEEDTKVVDAEANCEISIGSEICEHEPIELPHCNELAISCSSEQCSASYNVIIDKEQVTEAEPVEETIPISVNELSVCTEIHEVEDERMPETPTSVDSLHALHRRFLFERRESGTESLDGSIASEIDGNEILTIDHLKAALKAERKSLSALYAELEEERSASAIAANQTMAMITRLQEEKAAMQMEALQYQRMMEEQSEYDQEALQLLNELMMKREREKQELEKELEVFRKKVLIYEAKEMRKVAERSRMNGNDNGSGTSSASSSADDSDDLSFESHEGDDCNYSHKESNQNTPADDVLCSAADQDPTKHLLTLDESLADFEEERLSILEQLKALEEKLFSMDDDELKSMGHQHFSNENGHFKGDYEFYGDNVNGGSVNGFEHDLGTDGKLHYRPRKRLLPLFDATVDVESEEGTGPNHEMANGSPRSVSKPMIDDQRRLAIAEEVDNVYERLQALEADREFLKHCIRSLKKGDKGMDLLQEILQHLRDLRNVELRVRNAGDALASLSSYSA